jgi:L-serine deaminase
MKVMVEVALLFATDGALGMVCNLAGYVSTKTWERAHMAIL